MKRWQNLTSDFVCRSSFASGYHYQELHNAIINPAYLSTQLRISRRERVEQQPHVWLPLWTMNTSCSRTEQPMLTDVSPFENFLSSALLGLVPSRSQMASVSEGWEDPEKIWTLRMVIKVLAPPPRDNWSYSTWDRLKLLNNSRLALMYNRNNIVVEVPLVERQAIKVKDNRLCNMCLYVLYSTARSHVPRIHPRWAWQWDQA